jgi:hypothetical protein
MPMPPPPQPNAQVPGPGRGYRPSGGIPDGLVVGVLALLLGTVTLFWLCTALAALVTHGRLPHPLPFLDTAGAIRHLATQPNNLPRAWPDTPAGQLPSALAFWVTFFLLLAALAAAALSIAISLTRLRAKVRARAEESTGAAAGGMAGAPDAPGGARGGHAASGGTQGGYAPGDGRGSRPAGVGTSGDRGLDGYPPHGTSAAAYGAAGGSGPVGVAGGSVPGAPAGCETAACASGDGASGRPASGAGAAGGFAPDEGVPGGRVPGGSTAGGGVEPPAGARPAAANAGWASAGPGIPQSAEESTPVAGPGVPPGAGRAVTPGAGRGGTLSTGLWETSGAAVPAVPADGSPAGLRLGSGTTCLFVPAFGPAKRELLSAALTDHHGPTLVLTSATRADAMPQRPPHAAGGLLFDPMRLIPDEEAAAAGLTRLRWAPHSGCQEPAVAAARAQALLAPLRRPHRPALSAQSRAQLPNHLSEAAAHDTARTLLRCWLHAAALDGRPIRQVHRWSTGHQSHDAVRILRTTTSRDVADGWGGELEAALTTHPELRESARTLVRTALDALSELHVLQSCTPTAPNERLDVESFLQGAGILYVAGPASEQRVTSSGSVMPLLTALADDVVEHGRRMAARSPSGRLDPPLLSLLDDVAAVAPLPRLPELINRGGNLGLPTVAVLRSPEQARARWGADAARSLWTKADSCVVLGDADPTALRPLLDELASDAPLPGPGQAVVLTGGKPPALASLPVSGRRSFRPGPDPVPPPAS